MEIDIFSRFPWLKSSDSVDIVAQAALFEVLDAYPHLFEFPLSQVKNEDGKHSIESTLRANKLRDFFRRGSETLQIGDFIDFLECYKTIHGAERALFLSTLGGSKELVKVIQDLLGRFPEGHLYRELSKVEKEARTTLFDQCFHKESNGEIKGRLVSEILELPLVLDTQDSSTEARALRNCLKHAFTEASGYVFGLFGGEARWSAVKIAQELKKIQGELKKSSELHGQLGEILTGYESDFRSGRRKTLGRD